MYPRNKITGIKTSIFGAKQHGGSTKKRGLSWFPAKEPKNQEQAANLVLTNIH